MHRTPVHHHVILWVGVIGFALLIGVFWMMGLPDIFTSAPSQSALLEDTRTAWDRVRKEADQTIALFNEQNRAAEDRANASEELKSQLKKILSETTVAAPIEQETNTASTTTTTIE